MKANLLYNRTYVSKMELQLGLLTYKPVNNESLRQFIVNLTCKLMP